MSTPGRAGLLFIDGFINLVLGVALLFFDPVAGWLGAPGSDTLFYPTILGAVLVGIGIALFWEGIRGDTQPGGLGLAGAVAINLSGGLVLTAWLLFGDLILPLRGRVILWGLATTLVLISLVELRIRAKQSSDGMR
jgi:hypothetical protein